MSSAGASPGNKSDSPSVGDESVAFSDSSSSDEVESITLGARLHELAFIDRELAVLLTEAASAIDTLNPAIREIEQHHRRDAYAEHAELFLNSLETIAARLKRSIRGLEEDEVALNSTHLRSGFREEGTFRLLTTGFMKKYDATGLDNP